VSHFFGIQPRFKVAQKIQTCLWIPPDPSEVKVSCDGASLGNPGRGGCWVVIREDAIICNQCGEDLSKVSLELAAFGGRSTSVLMLLPREEAGWKMMHTNGTKEDPLFYIKSKIQTKSTLDSPCKCSHPFTADRGLKVNHSFEEDERTVGRLKGGGKGATIGILGNKGDEFFTETLKDCPPIAALPRHVESVTYFQRERKIFGDLDLCKYLIWCKQLAEERLVNTKFE
ncbi:hypothetical protein GIB67_022263, partial [Kingdonia uniflora]